MRNGRPRGLTLVELMIAVSLMTVLIGTASFVFLTSQRIWSRIDRRLQCAQANRYFISLLEQDLSRYEHVLAATGIAAMTVKRVGNQDADPFTRNDSLVFVTHNTYHDTEGYCLVSYGLDSSRTPPLGLGRARQWLMLAVDPAPPGNLKFKRAKWSAADKLVPASPSDKQDYAEMNPYARGFRVRWYRTNETKDATGAVLSPAFVDGAGQPLPRFLDGDPNPPGGVLTSTGSWFNKELAGGKFDPAALELTITVIEAQGTADIKADTGKLSITKVFVVPGSSAK